MNPLNHVAIIMDGNGRWGLKNQNSRNAGHKAGIKTVELIIKEAINQNIKYLTLYAFSTENWKRPKEEVNYLLKKNNIKIKFIGTKNFSTKINNFLKNSEKITSNNNLIQINIALNYGSKAEIISSINKIFKKNLKINEKNISKFLFTNDIPDPEILIRTGNTKRLSNFLLWQLAYSEIYFVNKLWPEFTIRDYNKILNNYRNLKRNFGAI